MIHILDTCICIDLIRQKSPQLTQRISELDIAISSITLGELEYGVYRSSAPEKNRTALQDFCEDMTVYPFDENAAAVYGKIRAELTSKRTPIGPLDTLIAAHALSLEYVLVTNNLREFQRVNGLKVEPGII